MIKKIIKEHYLLIIFIIFYFIVIAFKLISHPTPFYDWDESINAEVGKEMINKLSLVPLWQGKVWLDKPPLPFLFFGIIMKLTPFVAPEISLRITSLVLSVVALIFIYLWVLKIAKEKFIAILTVVITSFVPIFVQRAQIVNLDVFLIIGWIGYLMFFNNFYISLFFLALAVLTKSLLGFYAPGILFIFYIVLYIFSSHLRVNRNDVKKALVRILIQVVILMFWYFLMFLNFGKAFWEQHIIESHFRRVTSSIESHFGKRTYYVDLIIGQLGVFFWFSVIGFILFIWNGMKKLVKEKNLDYLLFGLFLLPWFIFLNLTKTKIFWYLYPSIPEFSFLAVFAFTLLKKQKVIYLLSAVAVTVFVFYSNFNNLIFFKTFYSSYDDHYYLTEYAKNHCNELNILVGKDSRNTTDTLEKLGLTISSTKIWGDHPSIVYYFGRKVNFIYDEDSFFKNLTGINGKECYAAQKNDIKSLPAPYSASKNFNTYLLFE